MSRARNLVAPRVLADDPLELLDVEILFAHQAADGGDLVGVDDGGGFVGRGDSDASGGVEDPRRLEDVDADQQVRLP